MEDMFKYMESHTEHTVHELTLKLWTEIFLYCVSKSRTDSACFDDKQCEKQEVNINNVYRYTHTHTHTRVHAHVTCDRLIYKDERILTQSRVGSLHCVICEKKIYNSA